MSTLARARLAADLSVRPLRHELAHVLRRRQGLIGVEALIVLGRAGGLSDAEIRSLVQSWEGRQWSRR